MLRTLASIVAALTLFGTPQALAQRAPEPPRVSPEQPPPGSQPPREARDPESADAAKARPHDARTAETARGRYVAGDLTGALEAWNAENQPVTESVAVYGTERTTPSLFAKFIGLRPGSLLTADRFLRAQRRLDQLPAHSFVKFAPDAHGRAQAEVVVDEPSRFATGLIPIGTIVADGLITREFELSSPSPTGHGERISGSWRWQRDWTRYTASVDVPVTGPIAGLVTLSGRWEDQVFDPGPGLRTTRQRRSFGAGFSQWATSTLWWRAGLSADRFTEGDFTALDAAVQQRLFDDLVAVDVHATRWLGGSAQPAFGQVAASVSVRSTTRTDLPVLSAVAGAGAASETAPYQAWLGAGTGSSAYAPLRAHPLVRHGVLLGQTFGRRLAFASVEYERPFWRSPFGPVSWAAFTDSARAWRRAADMAPTPWNVDVGGGLRVRAEAFAGVIGVDLARGVRDGRWYGSFSVIHEWPDR